jgi:DNA-binding MarR family transcriptional regulator
VASTCRRDYYSGIHHIAVDEYVMDVLMPDLAGHDHSPGSFLVYLALWTKLYRSGERSIGAILQDLASQTGLSKSAVQNGIRILKRRSLVKVTKATETAVPQYELVRHWVRRRARQPPLART